MSERLKHARAKVHAAWAGRILGSANGVINMGTGFPALREVYGRWQESWDTDPSKIRTDVPYLLDDQK